MRLELELVGKVESFRVHFFELYIPVWSGFIYTRPREDGGTRKMHVCAISTELGD